MRHRIGIAGYTGLGGNNEPVLLDNEGVLNKQQKVVLREFLKEYDITGCDYGVSEDEFKFGLEPTYFGDDLTIISVNKEKGNSYIQTGHAFGYYGTGVRQRVKYYKDYKRHSNFTGLVDKWHRLLFPND